MPEQVLLTELNKILISERRNRDRSGPDAAPEEQAPVIAPEQQRNIDPDSIIHEQERETLRLLLNYPNAVVEDRPLPDFLFFELEDVSFIHPVYVNVFRSVRSIWLEGRPIDSADFLTGGNPEERELVTGLVTRKYSLSRYWGDKYNIHVPDEPDMISELAVGNVNRMKYRLVQRMIDENNNDKQMDEIYPESRIT